MNTTKHTNGFTLVETLVSLFILSLALTGVFALLSWNFRIASSIKNSFVASALVQEGMEVARNLRDEDWVAVRDYGSFGSASRMPDGDYKVQWNSTQLLPVASVAEPLKLNSKSVYSYDFDATNKETIFYRVMNIKRISDDEIRVVVTVYWKGTFGDQSVSAEEHLFNWY